MKRSQLIWIALSLIILFSFFYGYRVYENSRIPEPLNMPSSQDIEEKAPEPIDIAPEKVVEEKVITLPRELRLKVPFTPQAPTANWDELHNEACEEASALMSAAYFKGDERAIIPSYEAEREIAKLTEWQKDKLGYHLSIDTAEAVRMIEAVYGLQAEVAQDFDLNTIKRALAEKKLVIAPVNGRLLGNPNFKQPGPIYHMFVITGYTDDKFITNDPGTKRGQDYLYTYETVLNAIGDYDHTKKETDQNTPAIIIVSK
jgi:hypothetical protein